MIFNVGYFSIPSDKYHPKQIQNQITTTKQFVVLLACIASGFTYSQVPKAIILSKA